MTSVLVNKKISLYPKDMHDGRIVNMFSFDKCLYESPAAPPSEDYAMTSSVAKKNIESCVYSGHGGSFHVRHTFSVGQWTLV